MNMMPIGENRDSMIESTNTWIDSLRCEGGMFDIPFNRLDADLGRRCHLIICPFPVPAEMRTKWKPNKKHHKKYRGNVVLKEKFTVAGVQKNYRGELCYRIIGDSDEWKFGKCASPHTVIFLDE